MGTILAIRDKTTLDLEGRLFTLDLDSERVTVREIIRSRVYQEVEEYNARQPEYFRGLVQPAGAEKTLLVITQSHLCFSKGHTKLPACRKLSPPSG